MQLTLQQLGEVRRALENAFDVFTFPRFLGDRLGKDPWKLGAPLMGGLTEMVEAVLRRANQEGWILRLVLSAVECLPENEAIAAVADGQGLTAASPQVITGAVRQRLEQVNRMSNAFLDIGVFLATLTALAHRVCRVEIPVDETREIYGTGFLVAPDLVITNYHVIELVDLGEQGKTTEDGFSARAADVLCRFDYARVNHQAINEGMVFKLAADWKYDASPYDPPGPQNLDYAILKLERAAGDEPIGRKGAELGSKRGFIPLPDADYPFPQGSPLWILQHPSGSPLKLALDTDGVVELAADRSRVTYSTNTEEGSSGSPCFNQHLVPVALHHAGDPAYPHVGTVNEGIPLSTIRNLLRRRGLEGGLGH